MADFILNFTEPSSFENRNKNAKKNIFLIVLGVFIFTGMLSKWEYGIILALAILVVQYFKSYRWNKYFITNINVSNNEAIIRYKEESKSKEIIGNMRDFKLKKKLVFNKSRTTCLVVYYKGTLLLKQFEIGGWNEIVFNNVVEEFQH